MAEVDVITAEAALQPAARMRRTDVREAGTKATRRQCAVAASVMTAAMHTQVARDRARLILKRRTAAQHMAHRTRQHTAVVARLIAVPRTVVALRMAAHLMAAVESTRNRSGRIGLRRDIKTAEFRRRYVSTRIRSEYCFGYSGRLKNDLWARG